MALMFIKRSLGHALHLSGDCSPFAKGTRRLVSVPFAEVARLCGPARGYGSTENVSIHTGDASEWLRVTVSREAVMHMMKIAE